MLLRRWQIVKEISYEDDKIIQLFANGIIKLVLKSEEVLVMLSDDASKVVHAYSKGRDIHKKNPNFPRLRLGCINYKNIEFCIVTF